MPTTKNGSDYILEIDTVTANTADRGTEINFKLLACLTANGMDGQTESQSTTNKCSGRWAQSVPGTKSATFNVEGQVVALSAGEISGGMVNAKIIRDLWKNGTIFFARITDATNDADMYEEAKVYISAYSDNSPTNDVVTFTATLTITGEVFTAPAA
jgi:hypothetical protein